VRATKSKTIEDALERWEGVNDLPTSPGAAYQLGYLQGAAAALDMTVLELMDEVTSWR
jgi:hypothetical protein